MLDLCVDLPMHFRTALNSHFLGMEAQTDDNMTKVRYRLGDIVDTKTYWVTALSELNNWSFFLLLFI